jgi:hypothetical protein
MEHWKVWTRGESIVITCRGHDKEDTIQPALSAFRALAAVRGEFFVIADLREMTGYDTAIRVHWQVLFREFRGRVKRLILVGARSAFIRMGAAAVGAFASIPVKFFDSWDEFERWERNA